MYDAGLDRITELANNEQSYDWNEAKTRMEIIDTILFECLDWSKSDCDPEKHSDSGYIDYALQLDSKPVFVLEAKRPDVSFTLPIESKPAPLLRSIKAIQSLSPQVKDAIQQVARYSQDWNSSVAVVSNGHQFIIFTTRAPIGTSWREGKALVFDSLKSIENNFKEFWNTLSRSGVGAQYAYTRLSNTNQHQTHLTPAQSIQNYGRSRNRNTIQADLQILGDLVFGGRIFEDRMVFHENCYSKAGAISQTSKASRRYLEDRYPSIFSKTAGAMTPEPATNVKGTAQALMNLTNIYKPILFLGDVGVGKSTFIERLFLIDYREQVDSMIIVRVDLADKPSRSSDLAETVFSEIDATLNDHYDIDIRSNEFLNAIYHGELKRFERSPQGQAYAHDKLELNKLKANHIEELKSNFDDHIAAIFHHLIEGQKRPVILVLDNVDQRDEDLQNAAFLQSQVASSKWKAFVILALRPETFTLAKAARSIAGYHPRAFTISPPRFDDLIDRRISTAIGIAEGKIPIPSISPGISVTLRTTGQMLKILQQSFRRRGDLVTFCEDLSSGNMRQALDYIIRFMSSPHVDATKIIRENNYVVPLHEFARGVMFFDKDHFVEEDSPIINIFNYDSNDTRDAFLTLFILHFLTEQMAAGQKSLGFISIGPLKDKSIGAGYSTITVEKTLSKLLNHKLIETELKSRTIEGAEQVRLTPCGSYYLTTLCSKFFYIDAVCLVTPIRSAETRSRLTDVRPLSDRLERAKVFVSYLNNEYCENFSNYSPNFWERIYADMLHEIERVAERQTPQQRRDNGR